MNTAKLIFDAKLILQQQHFQDPRRLLALVKLFARHAIAR